MIKFIAKRLLMLIPTVLGCATLTFFLMKLTPGDPALQSLGPKASPEALAALRHSWGLDQPLFIQYVRFLGQLATGNLGTSFAWKVPISSLIATRLPVTVLIMVLSAIFSVALALPTSMWVSRSDTRAAHGTMRVVTAIAQGMPTFFVGAMLMQVFAISLGWFPVGGYSGIYSLVLPAFTVSIAIAPILTRSLVTSLRESIDSEYVSFAIAKGLPTRRVMTHYALRNGSISGISVLGIQIGYLVGGTLVVENVFAVPGMGQLLMSSVLKRDFPVVQSSTVIFGIVVVLVYLLTDIAYGLLDPRAAQRG